MIEQHSSTIQEPTAPAPAGRAGGDPVGQVIGEILEVMGCVARGDFSHYCTFSGEDDLGALALGVNLMVSELHENSQLRRVISLEGKLQDKAEQLSRTVASLTSANAELERYKAVIEEHNRTLEEKVRERTAELTRQSAVLRRTNQELNDFTYIVSHDLKEPLRAIAAFSRFLAEEYASLLDAEGQNYVARINTNVGRLQEFIEDLLELSRIGRVHHTHEEVDLRALVEKVSDSLTLAISERGAVITVAGDWPRLRCDRTRVYQVFQNLIGNALKFSTRAPVIAVRAREDGDQYVFEVEDNGIGIDSQYFEQIFLVFQRLHSREAYPGSGAGLTICKKIVEQNGGRIWVESQPGAGSTFRFTLPKAPAPTEE